MCTPWGQEEQVQDATPQYCVVCFFKCTPGNTVRKGQAEKSTPPVCVIKKKDLSLYILTLPFKSLRSLRNVLVFERKAYFLSVKITSN
jgi:hypothetical protein